MKNLFVLLFTAVLAGGCCKPPEDRHLPPLTQVGSNTLGCYVDNSTWTPSGRGVAGSVYASQGGFLRNPSGGLDISIKAYSGGDTLQFVLRGISTVGTFTLSALPGDTAGNFGAYCNPQQDCFTTDAQHTGKVQITYADTSKGIVAGTFEMELFQPHTELRKQITKGRFDFKNHQ